MRPRKTKNHNRQSKVDSCFTLDITLKDFADAQCPRNGRVSKFKSKSALSSLNEEASHVLVDEDTDLLAKKTEKISIDSGPAQPSENNEASVGLCPPFELWIILSEYMRPEDVVTFSLICKTSYLIVNTPQFWIKLYKRYYSSKVYIPTFLKKHCLERHGGLKAKVVRSLFYTYPPYNLSLKKPNNSLKSLIGHMCELMWVQRASDKALTANNPGTADMEQWIYSFKMSNKPDNDQRSQSLNRKLKEDINYNPDEQCRLLEVICKRYIDPKCVIGMKLREASSESLSSCIHLKFSSAPRSRFGTDYGAIHLYLHAVQPPSIYDWWHPHFYNQQY